jgi:hypothetical protein
MLQVASRELNPLKVINPSSYPSWGASPDPQGQGYEESGHEEPGDPEGLVGPPDHLRSPGDKAHIVQEDSPLTEEAHHQEEES